MPEVSVIIPVYNGAEFIGQAIRSVLAQTYQDFEIVVVDDGSTDSSPSEIASIRDQRIVYIRQENAGLACARNTGLRIARGQYVALLDADDFYLPNKLELQLSAIESQPDTGLVAGGYLYVDQAGRPISEVRSWQHRPSLDLSTWLHGCPVIVNAVLLRREWLERSGGFDPALRRVEDWDLWLRLAYAGCSMAWTPEIVCAYRVHGGQMVRDGRSQKETSLQVLDHFFAAPGLPEDILQQRQTAYASAFLSGAFREYGADQVDMARQSLAEALTQNPALLLGQPSKLAEVLVSWAVNPITASDPFAYISQVLVNLPSEGQPLVQRRQELYGKAGLQSARNAWSVGNLEGMRICLAAAAAPSGRLFDSPSEFVAEVITLAKNIPPDQWQAYVDAVLDSLPPSCAHLRRFQQSILGQLYMARAFECYGQGNRSAMRHAVVRGIAYEPTWLRNRGVRSMLVKGIITWPS